MSRVRFGDVVRDVKLKVDRDNNPYVYYLAGEHFDSERLFIPRRGLFEGSDVGPAFIRIFKPGQVLYGSRRTYLKKVAVADFEGITANTTFVLETKDEDVLAQRLLPFIMLSDDFTKWSIEHSKGSTNPYVLFSDLAEYEFELPPIEIQRKLSDLLCEGERLKEVYRRLLIACEEVVKSRFVEMFGDPIGNDKSWPMSTVRDTSISFGDGPFGSNLKASHYVENGVRVIRLGNIGTGKFLDEDKSFISYEHFERLRKYECEPGQVVIGTLGDPNLRACLVPRFDVPCIHKADCVYYATDSEKLLPAFAMQVINQPSMLGFATQHVHGNTRGRVSSSQVAQLPMILPPLELQEEFAAFVSQVDKSEFALKQAIEGVSVTMAAILNHELGMSDVQ